MLLKPLVAFFIQQILGVGYLYLLRISDTFFLFVGPRLLDLITLGLVVFGMFFVGCDVKFHDAKLIRIFTLTDVKLELAIFNLQQCSQDFVLLSKVDELFLKARNMDKMSRIHEDFMRLVLLLFRCLGVLLFSFPLAFCLFLVEFSIVVLDFLRHVQVLFSSFLLFHLGFAFAFDDVVFEFCLYMLVQFCRVMDLHKSGGLFELLLFEFAFCSCSRLSRLGVLVAFVLFAISYSRLLLRLVFNFTFFEVLMCFFFSLGCAVLESKMLHITH